MSKEKLNDQELENMDENISNEGEPNQNPESVEKDLKNENVGEDQDGDANEEMPLDIDAAIKAIGELKLELRQAKREVEEHKSQAVRLQAEFINFRKRKEKEMANTIRFANEELVKELLPVLDNFDRTLDAIDKTDNLAAVKEGITLVSNSMRRQLTKIGLEPIDSKGKDFDVNVHDAITTVPVEEEEQKGIVIDEVEKGYKLKDKVIRFSKVVVGE